MERIQEEREEWVIGGGKETGGRTETFCSISACFSLLALSLQLAERERERERFDPQQPSSSISSPVPSRWLLLLLTHFLLLLLLVKGGAGTRGLRSEEGGEEVRDDGEPGAAGPRRRAPWS